MSFARLNFSVSIRCSIISINSASSLRVSRPQRPCKIPYSASITDVGFQTPQGLDSQGFPRFVGVPEFALIEQCQALVKFVLLNTAEGSSDQRGHGARKPFGFEAIRIRPQTFHEISAHNSHETHAGRRPFFFDGTTVRPSTSASLGQCSSRWSIGGVFRCRHAER